MRLLAMTFLVGWCLSMVYVMRMVAQSGGTPNPPSQRRRKPKDSIGARSLMAVLPAERGCDMASRHYDPDDLICRPCVFTRLMGDGSVEKTFIVHSPAHELPTHKHGELVVWVSMGGEALLKIVEET